jgi:hypothetical protein
MQNEDVMPVAGEQHEVGLPVPGLGSVVSQIGPLMDGQAILDE